MYSRKKNWTKNGPLRNSSINWIFLWRFHIQNYPKPPITEKRRSEAKYLTWNFIKLNFMKKTSMSNSVTSLGYIECYSSSSLRHVKSPSNSIRHNCQMIFSWSKRIKTILEIRKKGHISLGDRQCYYKFFGDFTNQRKKTNRAVIFSSRPFPNILKYRNHR